MVQLQHPIQVVSRLTGLSPHVIRVWEKRYGAVTPARTDTNRRLYSEDEVERLRLLALATDGGHKIGIIAKWGVEDLRRLVSRVGRLGTRGQEDEADQSFPRETRPVDAVPPPRHPSESSPSSPSLTSSNASAPLDESVHEALQATSTFNSGRLQQVLEKAAVSFGHNGVLHRVICPLAREIGDRWQRGEITAAHEHFASAILRDFLTRNARPFYAGDNAPRAIVATPAGQLHELGAVIVAAAAANLGWRPVYLGASLPSADIAGAALHNRARAVLLSVVYPADDPHLAQDLRQLRRLIPSEIELVVGGRAARGYAATLKQIGAITPNDLEELCDLLEELREARPDQSSETE